MSTNPTEVTYTPITIWSWNDGDACEFCNSSGWIDETGMAPRVDRYQAWGEPPDEPSPRLTYWLDRLAEGTCPDFPGQGYDSGAELAGITIWEEISVMYPALSGAGHVRPSVIRSWLESHDVRSDLVPEFVVMDRRDGSGWVHMTEEETIAFKAEHPILGNVHSQDWSWR